MKLGKAISTRIKQLREGAGLSQQEVATRAQLSLSLVAKLEQGKKADPRASTLVSLAAALGVRPGDLLDDLVALPVQPPAELAGETTGAVAFSDNGSGKALKPLKKTGKKKKKKKAKHKE
jgi:transcriptional regulator with XRE-family HTH domain